tara:strand:- start:70 stop:759 length:690 start_codon:yes stop_codon:yes gene_type:complete
MGIFDWFKKKEDEEKSLKELKQCDCGEVWCNSCQDQHKRCECGKFFHKNFDLCPYCHEENEMEFEIVKEYYENGKLKSEGNYPGLKNTWWSNEDSFWKSYYENGGLEREEEVKQYENSCGKTMIKEYYENGEVKSEGEYWWDCNCLSWRGPLDCRKIGKPCVECFIMEKCKDGLWKYYYRDGKLKLEGKYIVEKGSTLFPSDQRNGEWKVYDKTGEFSHELTYKNGELI